MSRVKCATGDRRPTTGDRRNVVGPAQALHCSHGATGDDERTTSAGRLGFPDRPGRACDRRVSRARLAAAAVRDDHPSFGARRSATSCGRTTGLGFDAGDTSARGAGRAGTCRRGHRARPIRSDGQADRCAALSHRRPRSQRATRRVSRSIAPGSCEAALRWPSSASFWCSRKRRRCFSAAATNGSSGTSAQANRARRRSPYCRRSRRHRVSVGRAAVAQPTKRACAPRW